MTWTRGFLQQLLRTYRLRSQRELCAVRLEGIQGHTYRGSNARCLGRQVMITGVFEHASYGSSVANSDIPALLCTYGEVLAAGSDFNQKILMLVSSRKCFPLRQNLPKEGSSRS